jgi:rhamnosyltransferase
VENKPVISVIIPVKNGSATIEACLKGILSQTLKDILDIIIIDSGSTDGTLGIIEKYPVHLIQIKPETFNHGLTRQLGVSNAKGEFMVLTVQDAIPASDNWIETMYNHFKDEKVMGVCGQQIVPHHLDKNPLDWFRPFSKPVPKIIEFKAGEFEKLSAKEQFSNCRWDDVTAMYRKSALIETPFLFTNFAEDALWAKQALSKGYKLVFDFNARIHHYHHNNFSFAFKRSYTVLYHTKLFFGYQRYYENFFVVVSRIFYRALFKRLIPKRVVFWTVYNLKIQIAYYSASAIFKINSLFLSAKNLEKAHKFWVGKAPQSIAKNIKIDTSKVK